MVSPYLRLPLRPLEEVLAARTRKEPKVVVLTTRKGRAPKRVVLKSAAKGAARPVKRSVG
ncbi:MAG: hypothetical protein QNJ94_16640 [Alphaproteobacteria bacterium]|nr:hypothetical protein [Alphaproteobacteria bacterium]